MSHLNSQSDAERNALNQLHKTIDDFYDNDGAAARIQTINDLLAAFFTSTPSSDARFRDYTDRAIEDIVFTTGEIIMFLSQLKEDFDKAKGCLPSNGQGKEVDQNEYAA